MFYTPPKGYTDPLADKSALFKIALGLGGVDAVNSFRKMKYEEQDRLKEEQKMTALAQLADQMSGNVVPSEGMGPIQPINDPRTALARMAAIQGDPSALINYDIQQKDPMRQLEIQLKKAQLAKANKPEPLDLKKLAESYALKKAAGVQPLPEEEIGAKAWESINRGEIDYDPDTGQSRPKYNSLFDQIPQVDLDNPGLQAPALNRPPMPGEMSALSKAGELPPMPKGLYPKAQLKFQEEAVKDIFEQPEKLEEERQRAQVLKDTADEIDNIILPAIQKSRETLKRKATSGFPAQVSQYVGGTPAFALDQALDPIRSATAIGKLIQMKESSPTGASGFGSLSSPELNLLLNRVSSLKIGQSDEDMAASLDAAEEEFKRLRDKAKTGYGEIQGVQGINGWSIERVE